MMTTNWKDFRKILNLTPKEEDVISLEKNLVNATVDVQEQNELTQNNYK